MAQKDHENPILEIKLKTLSTPLKSVDWVAASVLMLCVLTCPDALFCCLMLQCAQWKTPGAAWGAAKIQLNISLLWAPHIKTIIWLANTLKLSTPCEPSRKLLFDCWQMKRDLPTELKNIHCLIEIKGTLNHHSITSSQFNFMDVNLSS